MVLEGVIERAPYKFGMPPAGLIRPCAYAGSYKKEFYLFNYFSMNVITAHSLKMDFIGGIFSVTTEEYLRMFGV